MKTGPLSRHVLALYEAINHVNILCLFCLMLDQASSHRISVPHAGLKLLGWTTLDPQLVPRYFKKTCCLLFTMSCRGQHVHITTLQNIHRVSAHPSSMVPTAQFGQMDGLTLVQTGPGPVSGRILPYFRTPSGHPSAKKVRLKKKNPLHFGIV